jgi:regulator of ribosome biosynthesis
MPQDKRFSQFEKLILKIKSSQLLNTTSKMSDKKEYKPVTVDKLIPNTYDLGNLATFDPNPLDNDKLKDPAQLEEYLTSVTRDNVQLLINQILSLPVKSTTDTHGSSTGQDSTMTLIQLPDPTTILPREKGIPKAKAPTKWEQFAARKGIKAKPKDGKTVYDEETGEWVPKWGYKGKNKDLDSQWLVEVEHKVKNTPDELIDPRTLKRAERKKLIQKNELQQKRNLKNLL